MTKMGKNDRSVMVAVYGTPCAISSAVSNINSTTGLATGARTSASATFIFCYHCVQTDAGSHMAPSLSSSGVYFPACMRPEPDHSSQSRSKFRLHGPVPPRPLGYMLPYPGA
jgi:hypothetical protein